MSVEFFVAVADEMLLWLPDADQQEQQQDAPKYAERSQRRAQLVLRERAPDFLPAIGVEHVTRP